MNGTEREAKKKFTGNVALYLNTKLHRAPIFLQRNLRYVLASHRRQIALQRKRRREASMKPATLLNSDDQLVESKGTPKKKKIWSSREVQYILERKSFSQKDPVLRIDIAGIRDRLAKFRDKKVESEPPAKQARTSLVHATCSLTIWDSASPTQDTVVEQTRKCEIDGRTKPSGERFASIVMSAPFLVGLEELQPTRQRVSQVHAEPLFSMQIVLMAANDLELWPPVEMKLPTPKVARYTDQGGLVRFPLLVAKWHRLPQVPENDQEAILDLLATQDNTKYKPKLGLKINASWTDATSPLTLQKMEVRNGGPSSNRDHSSDYEEPLSTSIVYTEWEFEGLSSFMPTLRFEGHACPMCNGQRFRDAGEFHFHLINSHDLFKFKFSQKFESNDLGQSVAEGLVITDVADNYEERAANTVKDFQEICWHKPNTPFDLEAYLKGDESWLSNGTKRGGSLAVTYPEPLRLASRDNLKLDLSIATTIRPPDQVPDLLRPARKRFRVPKAPRGIQFYRLAAKRPLVEGEMISESDDDIDEEWLQEKHSDTIDSFTDTLPQEKRFMQRYDRHMLQEDTSSDLHSGEALIRFCRLNKAWLQIPTNKIEFHKKAAALKLQGSLSSSTILACSKIINSPISPIPPSSISSKRKGKAKAEDDNAMDIDTPPHKLSSKTLRPHSSPPNDSSKTPTPPADKDHLFGRCAICRTSILDVRDYIRCNNPFCKGVDNHLSCARLDARPSTHSWFCESCVRDGIAEVEAVQVAVRDNSPSAFGVPRTSTSPAVASALENVLAIRSRESSPAGAPRVNVVKRGGRKAKSNGKGKAKGKAKAQVVVINDGSGSEEEEAGDDDVGGSDDDYNDEEEDEEEEGEDEEDDDADNDDDDEEEGGSQETEQEDEDSDKESGSGSGSGSESGKNEDPQEEKA